MSKSKQKRNKINYRKTKKNKKGGKTISCKNKCKNMIKNDLKKTSKYKFARKVFSYMGIKDIDKQMDEEMDKILNEKKTLNDPVFKECINNCKKK